jgi:hypothetical protein
MPVALDFALARDGKSMPAKMAMMAMTTSNSMRVNPRWDFERGGDRKVIGGDDRGSRAQSYQKVKEAWTPGESRFGDAEGF